MFLYIPEEIDRCFRVSGSSDLLKNCYYEGSRGYYSGMKDGHIMMMIFHCMRLLDAELCMLMAIVADDYRLGKLSRRSNISKKMHVLARAMKYPAHDVNRVRHYSRDTSDISFVKYVIVLDAEPEYFFLKSLRKDSSGLVVPNIYAGKIKIHYSKCNDIEYGYVHQVKFSFDSYDREPGLAVYCNELLDYAEICAIAFVMYNDLQMVDMLSKENLKYINYGIAARLQDGLMPLENDKIPYILSIEKIRNTYRRRSGLNTFGSFCGWWNSFEHYDVYAHLKKRGVFLASP